jgi:hypothetical protein
MQIQFSLIQLYCSNNDCRDNFYGCPIRNSIAIKHFDINKKYYCEYCGEKLICECEVEITKLLWKMHIVMIAN